MTVGQLDEQQLEGPCDMCGESVERCKCEACEVCGEIGRYECYRMHGMQISERQRAARARMLEIDSSDNRQDE